MAAVISLEIWIEAMPNVSNALKCAEFGLRVSTAILITSAVGFSLQFSVQNWAPVNRLDALAF